VSGFGRDNDAGVVAVEADPRRPCCSPLWEIGELKAPGASVALLPDGRPEQVFGVRSQKMERDQESPSPTNVGYRAIVQQLD
jgi:hypothetical protein